MRIHRILLVLAAALPFACGPSPSDNSPATEATGVGAGCDEDGDCREGLSCFEELPGGACTKECTPSTCPEGTICVSVGGGQTSLCAPVCEAQSECREGYSCISVGRRSVCGL